MSYLSIRDISMRFGGLLALDDVSFEIERGSVFGLIGPNGSGKTTMLSIVAGALRPSGGTVDFAGRQIAGLPPYRICELGIGRTFQVVKPFANLTVRENVAVGAMYGRGGAKRTTRAAFAHADEALESVGLARVAERPASELTIPDRKRLEVAKALALDPEVLLLDEVMAGLNASEVDEALELIRALSARGLTIVIVEHLMRAIMSVSQTVVVLAEGKKIAQGPPLEVTRDPAVIEAYLGARFAKRQAERPAQP